MRSRENFVVTRIAFAIAFLVAAPALAQDLPRPLTATDRIAIEFFTLKIQLEQARDQIAALQQQINAMRAERQQQQQQQQSDK
jgi:hypothetical protein